MILSPGIMILSPVGIIIWLSLIIQTRSEPLGNLIRLIGLSIIPEALIAIASMNSPFSHWIEMSERTFPFLTSCRIELMADNLGLTTFSIPIVESN